MGKDVEVAVSIAAGVLCHDMRRTVPHKGKGTCLCYSGNCPRLDGFNSLFPRHHSDVCSREPDGVSLLQQQPFVRFESVNVLHIPHCGIHQGSFQ
jgi:hypothetical protein